ncbi:MAG: glutamine amidotransferase [Deltaproteobacteria bacterium]|nr:glutamine amidotransferase [Deltaproteobacteria bacterium]MBW2342149.1 glutamine amidotransferase [Deltaproteobacteria bacterium]
MKSILIIKTGSTFPAIAKKYGDFEDWIISGTKIPRNKFSIVSPFMGQPLPEQDNFAGIIITGSHSMITEYETWSENIAKWVPKALEIGIAILGICYGHQLLAHAMGGRAGFHPNGFEIGTVKVSKTRFAKDDLLFADLPASLEVQVNHSQSVLKLPPEAKILASNTFEPHQAFVLQKHAWGVQFHPEFNQDIMKCYIMEQKDLLLAQGYDIDQLMSAVRPSLFGEAILNRFCEIALEADKA